MLVIPGCVRERDASLGRKRAPKEQNQAGEAEKHGRRLALRLDPQVGPALLTRGFPAAAFQERAPHLFSSQRLVRRKERLGDHG